ncbi:MAG: hypothetical protein RML40_10490, partial [Bacteroidota bacterium]|nr:hypothetical protein [Candidatus Kapabacteria bacterium]MDW8220941.1 hypothetical protein [Bacteroidota bacterium]
MEELMRRLQQSLKATDDEDFLRHLSEAGLQIAERLNVVWRSPFLKDIQRSYPQYWQSFTQRRRAGILSMFQMICEEGERRGVLRKEINYELFTLMYLACVEHIMQPSVMHELRLSGGTVFQMIMAILFGGTLTDKGRSISAQFEQYWLHSKPEPTS